MAICKWCGSLFNKKHNREEYCSEKCRCEGNKENGRNRFRKYYKKYGKRNNMGSGSLGASRRNEFDLEFSIIQKELKRLKIK